MKKRVLLLLSVTVIVLLAIFTISCGQNEKVVLNVYN